MSIINSITDKTIKINGPTAKNLIKIHNDKQIVLTDIILNKLLKTNKTKIQTSPKITINMI